MIRIVKLSGKYYGIGVDLTKYDEIQNIEIFTSEGTPVILVDDLSDLDMLDIDPDDVQMLS